MKKSLLDRIKQGIVDTWDSVRWFSVKSGRRVRRFFAGLLG